MDAYQFEFFYMLHYLEGELLVANKHPTLSSRFPNKQNLFGGKMNQAAESFFENIQDNNRLLLQSLGLNRKPSLKWTKKNSFQDFKWN